jgi:hypothetical protein
VAAIVLRDLLPLGVGIIAAILAVVLAGYASLYFSGDFEKDRSWDHSEENSEKPSEDAKDVRALTGLPRPRGGFNLHLKVSLLGRQDPLEDPEGPRGGDELCADLRTRGSRVLGIILFGAPLPKPRLRPGRAFAGPLCGKGPTCHWRGACDPLANRLVGIRAVLDFFYFLFEFLYRERPSHQKNVGKREINFKITIGRSFNIS